MKNSVFLICVLGISAVVTITGIITYNLRPKSETCIYHNFEIDCKLAYRLTALDLLHYQTLDSVNAGYTVSLDSIRARIQRIDQSY